MAEGGKAVSIIPLKGTNYPSWKLQHKMILVREGLWGIVAGTEKAPDTTTEVDKHAKYMGYMGWSNRTLATIVLAIDPSLLYLVGDPVDPAAVWKKLSGHFRRRLEQMSSISERNSLP